MSNVGGEIYPRPGCLAEKSQLVPPPPSTELRVTVQGKEQIKGIRLRMVNGMGDAGCWLLLGLSLLPVFGLGSQDNGKVIRINKVQHQPLRVGLAEPVALPCLFLLQPSASLGPNEPPDPPRIKWSKVQSASGQKEDVPVLVAKENVVKVVKAYEGRVSLPGYPSNRYNATLVIGAARASDAGLYRCEVVAGIDDEQDLLPLEVTGVVFHYRAASNRYALTFSAAQHTCRENSAVVASPRKVFYVSTPGRLTSQGARKHCQSWGALLATTGQLYLAWRDGLDQCDPGWLADGSVRYPIRTPRKKCGGDEPGVRTVYQFPNRTGFPDPASKFDAYCYKGSLDRGQPEQDLDGLEPAGPDPLGIDNVLVEHAEEQLPLARNELLPKEREDPSVSGDSREITRDRYNLRHKLLGPVLAEDEQLQRVTASPAGKDPEPPQVGSERAAATVAPVLEGAGVLAETVSPKPSSVSFPAGPGEDQSLNMVDQAPAHGPTWHAGITQEPLSADLQPPSQSPAPELPQEGVASTMAQDNMGASSAASKPEQPSPTAPDEPSHLPHGPESTKKSVSSGLNGRYFQLQGEGQAQGVDGNAWGGLTPAPGLEQEMKGRVDNAVEILPTAKPTAKAHAGEGAYPLSNEVDGPAEGQTGTASAPPSPSAPGQKEQPQWTLRLTPPLPQHSRWAPPDQPPASDSPWAGHATDTSGVGDVRGDYPQAGGLGLPPPGEDVEDSSGEVTSSEEGATPIPPLPALPRAHLHALLPPHAEDPGAPPSAHPHSGGSEGSGAAEFSFPERKGKAGSLTERFISLAGRTGSPAASTERSSSKDPRERAGTDAHRALGLESLDEPPGTEETLPGPAWELRDERAEDEQAELQGEGSVTHPAEEIPSPEPARSDPWVAPAEFPAKDSEPASREPATQPSPAWAMAAGQPRPQELEGEGEDVYLAAALSGDGSAEQRATGAPEPESSPSAPAAASHPEPNVEDVSGEAKREEPPTPWGSAAGPPQLEQRPRVSASPQDPLPSLPTDLSPLGILAEAQGLSLADREAGSGEEQVLPFAGEKESPAWRGESKASTLAQADPCETNPCLHGGTCQSNGTVYSCSCDQGFTGENCEIDTEGCDRGWHKFQGHCYRYFAHRRSWEDAERDCRRRAGHLASIHSPEEHGFINSFGHENTWIGLNDRIVEQDFQWTDNTGLQYENWRENQPDNFFAGGEDCVVLVSHEIGKWNDVPCNYNLPYICKKGTVLCGPPPAVENAFPVGKQKEKYSIHSTVRYQCEGGFTQRHVPTIKCHSNGKWDRPKILCTKPRRSHRTRRHHHRHHNHPRHHHNSRKERRKHRKLQLDWMEEGNYF
ncbi:tyrosine-protein phosphatase non-receptor type 23 [Platysternon megacephalum]|uniref:Tyrosine-protein phosphatase non-receptor type 23 n=1 Tax=Platysternon megacephalum TaxID=55544 RepID=A0A4D9E938_9SAUR|nr:tyrosine-protein phosphatase non-receptor type 23 [Platysternon megacephalum]